jgi:uncharacterized protein YndB with AHSA1/START domain
MQRFLISALAIIGSAFASPAAAEVVNASASAFILRAEQTTSVSPEQVWRSLGQIGRWWSGAHTYSRDARRLRLDVRAGGCFCEIWGQGQSVEHARVVMVMEREGTRTLRMMGGLGPLQDMGATGVLTFVVAEDAAGAKITMSYRVSGDPGLGLDALAPIVDGVLNEQLERLGRYTRGETLN